jgi:hypothetical protein
VQFGALLFLVVVHHAAPFVDLVIPAIATTGLALIPRLQPVAPWIFQTLWQGSGEAAVLLAFLFSRPYCGQSQGWWFGLSFQVAF